MSGSPDKTRFATFCMSNETEKICHKLEEAMSICYELRNNQKAEASIKKSCLLIFLAPISP